MSYGWKRGPPNIEGKGEITQRELVKNALRMRPDRIIVGEVRAGEAFDMLQAMNTGHDGSMTTVHANTARDALSRVEQMIGMSGIDIPAALGTRADRLGDPCRDPGRAACPTAGAAGQPVRDHRHGRRRHHHAGDLPLPPDRRRRRWRWSGPFRSHRHPAALPRQSWRHGVTLAADLFRPDAKFEA